MKQSHLISLVGRPLIGAVMLCCSTAAAQDAGTKPRHALNKKVREAETRVDSELPDYKPTERLSGQILVGGSDIMNSLIASCGEKLRRSQPNVSFAVVGVGKTTALAELLRGRSAFGMMTREFSETELKVFEEKYGYRPQLLTVAFHVVGVMVHKDNPIESLTLAQLDAIFSEDRKLGGTEEIATWGQLGLKREWENRPITLHGRNAASGTYSYFKARALAEGTFKASTKEHPGARSLLDAVSKDPGSIGYTGIGYSTEGVRAVPLAPAPEAKPVAAMAQSAYSGDYPLARPLYIAVNIKPGTQLDPLRREFVQLVFSKQGQALVVVDGYVPVNAKIAREQLGKVGLDEQAHDKKRP